MLPIADDAFLVETGGEGADGGDPEVVANFNCLQNTGEFCEE